MPVVTIRYKATTKHGVDEECLTLLREFKPLFHLWLLGELNKHLPPDAQLDEDEVTVRGGQPFQFDDINVPEMEFTVQVWRGPDNCLVDAIDELRLQLAARIVTYLEDNGHDELVPGVEVNFAWTDEAGIHVRSMTGRIAQSWGGSDLRVRTLPTLVM